MCRGCQASAHFFCRTVWVVCYNENAVLCRICLFRLVNGFFRVYVNFNDKKPLIVKKTVKN